MRRTHRPEPPLPPRCARPQELRRRGPPGAAPGRPGVGAAGAAVLGPTSATPRSSVRSQNTSNASALAARGWTAVVQCARMSSSADLRLAGPGRQALEQRARVVHRLNGRLRQADQRRRPVRRRPSSRDSDGRGTRSGRGWPSRRPARPCSRGAATGLMSLVSVPRSGRSYTGLTPATISAPTSPRESSARSSASCRIAARALVATAASRSTVVPYAPIVWLMKLHSAWTRTSWLPETTRPRPRAVHSRSAIASSAASEGDGARPPPRMACRRAAPASPRGASRRGRSRRARRAAGGRHSSRSATAAIRSARGRTSSARVSLIRRRLV